MRRRPPDQVAQALDCPAKNRSEVRKSNELVNRTINILRAAHNAGSEFGIESPADHGDTNQPELFVDADHAPFHVARYSLYGYSNPIFANNSVCVLGFTSFNDFIPL